MDPGARPATRRGCGASRWHMPRGRGLLAVPADTWQLRQLGVETLKRHPLGALKVERGPELVRYVARFADASGEPVRAVTASENTGRETTAASERWSTADRIDRTVPREYVSTLQKWLSDRGIATLAEHASSSERGRVVAAIMRGFLRDYSYAVTLPSRIAPLPLRQFLQDTRRGHCEFFRYGDGCCCYAKRVFPRAMRPAMQSANGASWNKPLWCADAMPTLGPTCISPASGLRLIQRPPAGNRLKLTPHRGGTVCMA